MDSQRYQKVIRSRAVRFGVVVACVASVVVAAPATAQGFLCDGKTATIVGTSSPDVLNGTPGDDVIVALGGADVIHGRGGSDTICAGYGADTIRGGVGADVIFGGPGADVAYGGAGHDDLYGGPGRDTLQGNTGADAVSGGPGGDTVMGGLGLDVVSGGLGPDRVTGGRGLDRVDGGAGNDVCSADDRVARCEGATSATTGDGQPIRVDRVVHISIDGLRSDFVTPELAPTLTELRSSGVSTLNARNDPAVTKTLPNHTSQFTGRSVTGADGHGVDYNNDHGRTVHDEAGFYVDSVFDVVHDYGFATAAFVGKEKFNVLGRSWNETTGAIDTVGRDDGRNKIDVFVRDSPEDALAMLFETLDDTRDLAYVFFHLRQPDSAGHSHTWGSTEYELAVSESDRMLGVIMDEIRSNSEWADTTAVIVTSDHGGPLGGDLHDDHELVGNYRIPFLVWAPGVTAGADLYDLNPQVRRNPGDLQVGLGARQPIRGHEVGNLALDLLGMGPIPGSTFNANFDLALR